MTNRASAYVFATILSVNAIPSIAQVVSPVHVVIEPTQMMSEGRLLACGVKMTLVEAPPETDITVATILITTELQGIVTFKADKVIPGTPISFRNRGIPKDAWLRFGSEDAIEFKNRKALDEAHLAGQTDGVKTLVSVIGMVEKGSRIQIGLTPSDGKPEKIYSGQAELKDASKVEFRSCIREITSKTVRPPEKSQGGTRQSPPIIP